MEEWRDIQVNNRMLQISNIGRLRNENMKIFSTYLDKNGYKVIRIRPENKVSKIHRLVATAFIPNPNNKPQVNHINGIKSDNRVENLEWVTNLENSIHAHKNGLITHASGENHPMYGKHHSEESKEKNRKSSLGQKAWNKGKHGIYSKETLLKISIANKKNSGKAKKVMCIETGVIYISGAEAGRNYNVTRTKISDCCLGKIKSINGLHFKYLKGE